MPDKHEEPESTPRERELIRREFMVRLDQARSLREGMLVGRWVTGPDKGRPKPSAAVRSMLERGLVRLEDRGGLWLTATFTPDGLEALRRMARDPRALPPDAFSHLLDELATLV